MGATLAIDAGTTVVKAAVFDDGGRQLAVADVATSAVSSQPGHTEQDMDELWRAVVRASGRAVAAAGVVVGRVAVTAQGDGAWLVDAGGRPTGRAILWNDARATDVVTRWRADGTAERAAAVNRSLSSAGLPNAILRHLLEHDPQRLDGAAAVLTCGSWIFLCLTGVVGLHESDASAPWLDVVRRTYSDELVDLFGVASVRRLLPPVLASEDAVAPITADAAAALAITPGTPVVLAPYDLLTATAGSGAVAVGDAVCILGTTLCVAEVRADADVTRAASGLTLADREGRYLRAIPTLAGTGVLDWFAAMLGFADTTSFVGAAAAVPPGAGGVRLWPYFSPAGERAPFNDPDARGCLAGLSFDHGAAHIARAALEGLAHVIRECLDALADRPRTLALAGGGARSDEWCRIIADITGVAVVRPTCYEVGARGAMLHAAVVTGQFSDLASAAAVLVLPAPRSALTRVAGGATTSATELSSTAVVQL